MMEIKHVQTTCAYCASGCQIDFLVDEEKNRIIEAKPLNGATNEGTLCLKGYYGWDYLNDPKLITRRITKPMIRRGGKGSALEPVEWDEAIRFAAENLNRSRKNTDRMQSWGPPRPEGREMRRAI